MSTAPARRRRSVLSAHLVLVAIGAIFFVGSFAYPWVSPQDGTIGAAVLPRTAGLLLLLTGLALLVQEWRVGTVLESDGHSEESAEHGPQEQRRVHRKLAVVTVAMVVCALLIPIAGMLPTLAVLTLFLVRFVEKLSWPVSLATAAGMLIVSYALFVVVLQVPLPWGVLDPAIWGAL